jgi:hypothetical protein
VLLTHHFTTTINHPQPFTSKPAKPTTMFTPNKPNPFQVPKIITYHKTLTTVTCKKITEPNPKHTTSTSIHPNQITNLITLMPSLCLPRVPFPFILTTKSTTTKSSITHAISTVPNLQKIDGKKKKKKKEKIKAAAQISKEQPVFPLPVSISSPRPCRRQQSSAQSKSTPPLQLMKRREKRADMQSRKERRNCIEEEMNKKKN